MSLIQPECPISKKPEKISIGPMPARRETQQPPPRRSPAPAPASSVDVKSDVASNSYIRPEKKKANQVKRKTPPKALHHDRRSEPVEEDSIEDWSDTEEFEELEELEEL
jgi:hypothetical protein